MKLVDAMFEVFDKSKFWFRLSIIASFALVLISIFGQAEALNDFIVYIAVASFLIQTFSFFARVYAEKQFDLAEYIRRSFMISDGLGTSLRKKDIAQIMLKSGKTSFTISPASDSYYESKLSPGPVRLAENIRETSFFTSHLSESSSNFFFALSVLAFLGFFISLVVAALTLKDFETINSFATATLSLVGFIASSDFLSLAIKFRSLHDSSKEVYNGIDALLAINSDPSASDVLLFFADYNCATIASPPIPGFIYDSKRDFLNELWKKTRNP